MQRKGRLGFIRGARRRWPDLLASVLPILVLALQVSGQVINARYSLRQFTSEHGLPQNSVTALCQTPDGYLWAGTPFGLARFDGIRFTVFDQANTPSLAQCGSDAVTALVVGHGGSLFVATLRGLLETQAEGFRLYAVTNGLPDKTVLSLARVTDWICVGTQAGLGLLRNGSFEQEPWLTNFASHAICALAHGTGNRLWVGSDHGLFSVVPASGTVVAWDHPEDASPVTSLYVDRIGRLWVRRANYQHLQLVDQ